MNRTPKKSYEAVSPGKTKNTAPVTPTSMSSKKIPSQPMPQNQITPFKMREKVFVIPQLQEIIGKMSFNVFQPFPFEQLEGSKDRINRIFKTMQSSDQARCLLHGELLNLYCEKQRQMICVSCVYKDQKHKGHNIVPLEKTIKSLQFQAIRMQEKVQVVVDKLLEWEQRVSEVISDLSDTYLSISNNMAAIFKSMVTEIQRIETECSKTIQQNFSRTNNIIRKYSEAIERARGTLHAQLRNASQLGEIDKIGYLKELNVEMFTCENLIKKTNETIVGSANWKDIDLQLDRLNQQKRRREDGTAREKQIYVTEF